MAPASDHPFPATIERMNQIYALRNELDSAWAVRPLDLTDYRGLQSLVLEYPAGDSLNRLIGQPLQIGPSIRGAISILWA
jgi:hypothetical protein